MNQTSAQLWPDASLDSLLEIASQKYDITFEPVRAAGITLQILQIANMQEILDGIIKEKGLSDALTTLPLWAKIWPASIVLAHCLQQIPTENQKLLEIGAGCGVTGLMAAALGYPVVCISDINEDALLFARINVLKNKLDKQVTVCKIDITEPQVQDKFTCIVGAEILYLEQLYRPLAKFLNRTLDKKNTLVQPQAILSSDHRRNPKRFFKLAQEYFSISHNQVSIKEKEADGAAEKHLISLHRLVPAL